MLVTILAAIAIVQGILALVLAVKGRSQRGKWSAVLLCCGFMFWAVYAIFRSQTSYPLETQHLIARFVFCPGVLVSLALLGFTFRFIEHGHRYRWEAILLGCGGLPYLFIGWSSLIRYDEAQTPLAQWELHIHGPVIPIYTAWMCICALAYLAALVFEFSSRHGQYRIQLRYVIAGLSLYVAGLLYNALRPGFFYMSPQNIYHLYGSLAFTASVTYIYLKPRLHDFRNTFLVSASFIITLSVLSWVTTFLIDFLTRTLYYSTHADYTLVRQWIWITAILIIQPVLYLIYRLLKQLFFKSLHDSRQVLHASISALSGVRQVEDIQAVLRDALERLFCPQLVALYLAGDDRHFQRIGVPGEDDASPQQFQLAAPMADVFHSGELAVTEELLSHPGCKADFGAQLSAWNAAMAVPLLVDDRLRGICLLGEKRSGDGYTQEDLRLLDTLGKQAAIALDNVSYCEQLQQINATLEERVQARTEELTEQTRELEAANTCLEEADRAKDHFLAVVSHELLNPLTSILGWSEVALAMPPGESPTRALEIIHQSAAQQQRLVNDLLDASRFVHGKLQMCLEQTALWPVLLRQVESQRPEIEGRQLTLELHPPTTELPVMIDPIRIRQVIGNLLGNAMKFTPDDGVITVVGARDGDQVVITVADTGQGILPNELPHIFEMFKQGKTNGNGNGHGNGLGLGLALAKIIVELHGGDITVASAGKDRGSAFTIRLPLHPPVQGETGRITGQYRPLDHVPD